MDVWGYREGEVCVDGWIPKATSMLLESSLRTFEGANVEVKGRGGFKLHPTNGLLCHSILARLAVVMSIEYTIPSSCGSHIVHLTSKLPDTILHRPYL